ncbi:hypothetical protein [Streptomyces sp. KL116D]|uniref:hypothetical protein n=1 Tax=Streptomyces sp. KL116D TaxID=3045152 RepID=UPI0035576A0B
MSEGQAVVRPGLHPADAACPGVGVQELWSSGAQEAGAGQNSAFSTERIVSAP